MTDETDEEWQAEDRPIALERRPRRLLKVLFLVGGLALAAAGGAYVWMNMDRFMQLAGRETPESAEAAPGDKAMLTDLLATQQKTGEDLEALNQSVAAQQEQLKALTDQLTALASRVEALQSAVAPPPAPAIQPNARAQAVAKPAKKPARAAKPAGPISVGGAPLNAAQDAQGR